MISGGLGRTQGMNHIYDVYDGTGYRVAVVEASSKEAAEKAAEEKGYGAGYRVEVAYIDIGGKLMSWEAYMSS